MESKMYRLNEFINPTDGRSLVIDSSNSLVLGALPGLEHFNSAVMPLLPLVDGVVMSPGQARHLTGRTRHDAALLARADWTNALREDDFILPPETIHYVPLLYPRDALDLGVSALVSHFLLGHEEHIEAQCLRYTVQLGLEGTTLGMPLIVDVLPIGPRVVLFTKAIELGVSYALESGADGLVIPWSSAKSFETIKIMTGDSPVWVKPTMLDTDEAELATALELGATGFWLDERVFAQPDPAAVVRAFKAKIHNLARATG